MIARKQEKSLRIVIGSLAVGGAERHLSFILPRLVALGWSVKVITLIPMQPNDLSNVLSNAGVKIYSPKWQFKTRLLTVSRGLRLGSNFLRLWKDFLCDRQAITHYFLPEAYLLGAIAAKFALVQRPQLMSRRSLNLYQAKRPLLKPLEHYFHKKMTYVLGNSQAIIRDLACTEDVPPEKLKLIYNGIPLPQELLLDHMNLGLRNCGSNKPTCVLIMVANLIPYKGHADVLHALSLVKNQGFYDWCIWMVGRDSGILKQLQCLAEELGLMDHVHWLGARDDVIDLYLRADLALLASHEEGFSNAILEAMACRLPLVVTDVGGNAEAVINQEHGLVVEKKSPLALAQAIVWMLQNPEQAKQMGINGYERVVKHFSLDACVNQYDDLYHSVLK